MTLASPRSANASDAKNNFDPLAVLKECCDQRGACRFQLVHLDRVCHATFLNVAAAGVELAIPAEERDEQLYSDAICCISFPFQSYLCAFLGSLTDVRSQTSGEVRVSVAIPRQLNVANLRRSFRVPVLSDAGVEATVRLKGGPSRSVKICDVTNVGVKFEVSTGDRSNLAIGSNVAMEVKFRGETIQRNGGVFRRTGAHCVLVFSAPTNDAERQQAEHWKIAVLALQQIWLRAQIR